MIRNIYGFDDLKNKVKIGEYDDGIEYVGGRIFYIDSNSTATYKFYDANMNEISNVAVGDAPMYSKKLTKGNNKEKYYVFDNTLISNKSWSYYDITTGATGQNIGDGKSNTTTILSITDTTTPITPSLWEWLKNNNTTKLNNCNDWYICSQNELLALKTTADSLGNSMLDSLGNTVSSWFTEYGIWVSDEYAPSGATKWNHYGQGFLGTFKTNSNSVFGIRSF